MSNLNRVLLIVTFASTIAITALVTRGITLGQISMPTAGTSQSAIKENELKQARKQARLGVQPQQQPQHGIAPLPNIVIADTAFLRADELDGLNGQQAKTNAARNRPGKESRSSSPAKSNRTQAPSKRGGASGTFRDPSSNGNKQSRSDSSDSYQILEDLPDQEKNELWWRIAAVAHRSGDVAYSYSLTAEGASPFAIEYSVAIRDIFKFFREGVKSDWRRRQFETRDAPRVIDNHNG